MKTVFYLVLGFLTAHAVTAHYIFQQLSVGSTKYATWQYVRRINQPSWNMNAPVTDLNSKDLRCNVGGLVSNGTETVNINAGNAFTFTLDTAVYHQGPVSVYMSKAPGLAKDYDGSGQWFKIFDWGPSGGSWPMRNSYTTNIPRCIPNGEYLLRIQQIGIHNPGAAPQFYISCAQVNVVGGGTASPSPLVSIPGAFKASDPGLTANIYNGGANNYVIPGPKVFSC